MGVPCDNSLVRCREARIAAPRRPVPSNQLTAIATGRAGGPPERSIARQDDVRHAAIAPLRDDRFALAQAKRLGDGRDERSPCSRALAGSD